MTVMVRVRCDLCGYVTKDAEGVTTYQVRDALEAVEGWVTAIDVEAGDTCYACSTASQKASDAAKHGGVPLGRFQVFGGTRRIRRRVEALLARTKGKV